MPDRKQDSVAPRDRQTDGVTPESEGLESAESRGAGETKEAPDGRESGGPKGLKDERPFLEDEEDEEDEGELRPPARLKWLRRGVVALVVLALAGNVFAIFPMVYNLEIMRFLRDTRDLQQAEAIREYKHSIVVVDAGDRKGTGFNIGESGLIVTNHHVMDGAETAVIGFSDGRTFRARVAARDPALDIALLSLGDTGQKLPALKVNPYRALQPGMRVYYIGNPLFFRHIAGEGSIIGMRAAGAGDVPVLLIDAPIFKGNSGSPVLTEDGEVVAVIFATTKVTVNGQRTNAGLAVAASALKPLLE